MDIWWCVYASCDVHNRDVLDWGLWILKQGLSWKEGEGLTRPYWLAVERKLFWSNFERAMWLTNQFISNFFSETVFYRSTFSDRFYCPPQLDKMTTLYIECVCFSQGLLVSLVIIILFSAPSLLSSAVRFAVRNALVIKIPSPLAIGSRMDWELIDEGVCAACCLVNVDKSLNFFDKS